ncbi:MAG: hypothetical protein JSS27_05765 [Planctomycetes bacterium]|nr:hypothetical protein [Planctomycetota bacterium]
MNLLAFISGWQPAWTMLAGAGCCSLALLWWAFVRLRGTTLRAAAGWGLLATLVLTITAALEAQDAANSPWRYLTTIVTLAPGIAVFGAKRPQDRAWFFIVLTLLVVLALPSLESWFLRDGGRIELHGFRSVFQLLLLLAGTGNYWPTRCGLAAALLAIGQWMLLDEFSAWPLLGFDRAVCRQVGTCLVLAAPIVAAVLWRVQGTEDGWAKTWLRFRNAYGLVWSVRVAERFNRAMLQRQSPLRLGWQGFTADTAMSPEGQATPTIDRPAARSLQALLTRFVAADWLPSIAKFECRNKLDADA